MYAIDLLNQFQDYNGTVLSNGKMYVYYLGRVALANVYHDIDGQVPIANPVELDNLGMAQVYVSNAHDYTIVLTDVYGNEMFSRDLFVNGSAEGGGNARLYEGIDPIVVNNEQNIISAKLANLGVESPLYFIEDTEDSTVIGVSGDFVTVSASGNLTAYKEDDVTWISGKDWSTDITNASANAYEQATANDYRPLFEGNNGKISAIDNSAILIPDVVDYSAGANINISNHVVSLDTAVELTDIINNRGAILDPSGLYVSNLQQTTYTEVGKDHVLSTDGSASIGWQLGNKAISIGDNSGNGDYRNLILGLDDVLLEERHQEPTPDKVYSLTGACESALSAINMINSGDNQAYSAGANINITDHVISGKDWSTEIGDKLDATAFSTVSGDYATVEDVESATSGKADKTSVIDYFNKPANVGGYGSVWASAGKLHAGYTAEAAYLYASGNSENFTIIEPTEIWTKSGNNNTIYITKLSATTTGFAAAGIEIGQNKVEISGGGYYGVQIRTPNTAMASAGLYYSANQKVPRYAPLFSAKNASGDGFTIWAGGARGFDASGNTIWDAAAPAKLIGWSNYQGTALDPRAVGINGSIIATVYPDNVPTGMAISSVPYSYMNGGGLYACSPDGTKISVDAQQRSITLVCPQMSSTAQMNPGDVSYTKYNTTLSANEIWSLTGSVQKREIEGDSATSAITAIAGSAIGGGSELPESASEALNVVTSNSASWDEISAYIASSASYITSLPSDLVYTGDITGKLDTTAFSTVSGDFYTTANESGFITGVDLSNYVVKSAFDELKSSYDALSSLFSTYSGQWLLPNTGV